MPSDSSSRDPVVSTYFSDLSALAASTSPLSRHREATLSTQVSDGSVAARDELIHANLRFVVEVATRYRHCGLTLAERISAGNAGLVTAAERFDGAKGCKFITYAVWWIRQAIWQAIAERRRATRLPVAHHVAALPDPDEGLELGGTSAVPGQAEPGPGTTPSRGPVTIDRRVLSLDAPLPGDDEGRRLVDAIADERQAGPDTMSTRALLREQLGQILGTLSDRELRIIRLYYGLDGHAGNTLEEIADQLGVTRERVRQLKASALDKLRHPSRRRVLQDMVGEFGDL
jgi:RNA polymerase primary sigma factor